MHLKRTPTILRPDQTRVLLRPFNPGSPERIARIIARIMALAEERAGQLLDQVSAEFSQRHEQIRRRFLERFEQEVTHIHEVWDAAIAGSGRKMRAIAR